MQDSHRQINHPLYIIAASFFVWLLAVLLIFGYTPTNDGIGYIEYAEKCLKQGQLYPTASLYHEIPFVWNIGIINLVELSLWLSQSLWPLLILLCLMKSVTCLITGLIAQKIFSQKTAIIAMLLFALYPNNWGQSTMISSEIPSTCFAVTAVYVAICQHNLFLCGLLLAVANWFRPTATIFISSMIVFYILCRHKRVFRKIICLMTGFLLFVIVVGSSTYLRTGHFIYQSQSYWFSMVDECYDGAEVAPHWGQPVWPEGTPRYIENHETMDCFQFERIWSKRSLDWLTNHKSYYLAKIPGRLYYMYQSDCDNMSAFLTSKSHPENNFITLPYRSLLSQWSTLNEAQWLSLFNLLMYFVLLALSFLASISLYRQRRFSQTILPVIVIVIGTLMLVIVMHGETRFKDPLMPFFYMLAAAYFNSAPTSAQ